MNTRYTDVQVDELRGAVFFDVIAYGERFPAWFSFEAIDTHAKNHGQSLETPEDHREYARRYQPELKDFAIEKYRRNNSVVVTAADVQ